MPIIYRTNPLFTCDESTLRRHDKTYNSLGDVKDVDPEVLQGVLNFIDTNTQVADNVEVSTDVKDSLGVVATTCIGSSNAEIGSLRLLNEVSFGIREQCKLITDLSYQMEDVGYGEAVLGDLTQLYKQMYDKCRGDSSVLPLRKDHLKFKVLSGRRRNKGVFRGRRIIPLFPTRTTKARQAKQSRFGRKVTSGVSETMLQEMLQTTVSDDTGNETPMEVSDNEEDVVAFVDLASYKGQDELREKLLTTPGLSQWLDIQLQVNINNNLSATLFDF